MTIKEYEKRLNEVAPDFFKDWKVVHLNRETLIVLRNDFIEFTIYDFNSGAWIEPSINTTLFVNGNLEEAIEILKVTNEFIKSYED